MRVRIWSVFNRDARLVLALSNEPGEFNFTRMPEAESDPVECPFATLQCYDMKAEPEILNLLFRSSNLVEFLKRLERAGFRLVEGRPKPYKIARL